MENLQKAITGDWFDIKSVMENYSSLQEFFDFPAEQLKETIDTIYQAVEGGIIEYKKNILNSVFSLTDSLKFDTASLNMLESNIANLKALIYVILIQRLITRKIIKLKTSDNNGENKKPDRKRYTVSDIGNIVREIQTLIKKEPELKSNKNILNILVQINRYKSETESMKNLAKNIPHDKIDNFKANYSQNINKILSSLVNSYILLLDERKGDADSPKYGNPLEQHDLSITTDLLKKQAENISRIKSTLEYAAKERFRIREIIATSDSIRDRLYSSVEEEKKKYFNMALSENGGRDLSRLVALEIMENLKKQLEI